jgi:hypothetical protein
MSKKLTQLIVNDVACPPTTRDRYQAYEMELKELLTMADNSVSEEVVGLAWRVIYSYDRMSDETYTALRAALRGGGVKRVSFLPNDTGTQLLSGEFLVESITQPTMQFFVGGKPVWHNLGFVLREVAPHD